MVAVARLVDWTADTPECCRYWAMPCRRSSNSGSPGRTFATRFAWCHCERRAIMVVTREMPMSPPMLRDRLRIPETWLLFDGGTPAYPMVLMGTKRNAIPTDW